MRVAYFSPLSPVKSGIAKYSELLIPHLSKLVDVDVFVDGYTPTNEDIVKCSCVYDYREFERRRVARKYDALIYQMGNNPYHEYIYDTLIRRPGITVLHDYLLHHFIAYKTLSRKSAGEHVEECRYCDGELSACLAAGRIYGLYTPLQDFLFPTNRRVIERSLAVLVHSEYVKEEIAQKFPQVAVEKISFAAPLFADAASLTKERSRKELGIGRDELAISCFGFITPPKRIGVVLRVFSRLRRAFPQARCYLVGEPSRGYDVRAVVRDLDLEGAVKITGYVEEGVFDQYVVASDICVNLRYPSAGESSGTAIYCMAAGKPVVISNYAQFAEFPDSCCAKIDLGPNEQNQLFEWLFKLASDEDLRASMGANARMLIEKECSPAKAADQYFRVIKRLTGGEIGMTSWRAGPQTSETKDYLLSFFPDVKGTYRETYINNHLGRFIETLRFLPNTNGGDKLLDLGSTEEAAILLRKFTRYELVLQNWAPAGGPTGTRLLRSKLTGEEFQFTFLDFNVERDRFPFDDETFAVCLCCEVLEHLTMDPMFMLSEVSRVLKNGGKLVLTTPNIARLAGVLAILDGKNPNFHSCYTRPTGTNRHNREYSPKEVKLLLEKAGFTVLRLETKDTWSKPDEPYKSRLRQLLRTLGKPVDLRGDNIFALAQKIGPVQERYPAEFYDV